MEMKENFDSIPVGDAPPPSYNPSYPVLNHINHFKALPPITISGNATQQLQPQLQQIPQPMLIVNGNPPVGPQPTIISCPQCGKKNLTRLEYKAAMRTHVVAALLCITGCIFLAPVPYCMNSCKNANHYCFSCGQYIGTYNRYN